eukprot:jgi/Picre1/35342/NNA_002804.t1
METFAALSHRRTWRYKRSAADSTGLRTTFSTKPSKAVASPSRRGLRVVAQRAVTKKVQVVLTKQVPSLGNEGELKSVPTGYYRNYLKPQGYAALATENILEEIQRQKAVEERARWKRRQRHRLWLQHCPQLASLSSRRRWERVIKSLALSARLMLLKPSKCRQAES